MLYETEVVIRYQPSINLLTEQLTHCSTQARSHTVVTYVWPVPFCWRERIKYMECTVVDKRQRCQKQFKLEINLVLRDKQDIQS